MGRKAVGEGEEVCREAEGAGEEGGVEGRIEEGEKRAWRF